jgi:hypothetical protein
VHFEPNVFFSWEDTAALGPYYVLLKAGEQQPTDTLIYTYTWKIPNNPAVSVINWYMILVKQVYTASF